MNHLLLDQLNQIHKQKLNLPGNVQVKSPGRINLIGEHTDYNDGFVMPAAIDKSIYAVFSKSHTNSYIYALDAEADHTFSVKDTLVPITDGGWKNYVLGVVAQLKDKGLPLGEFSMIFGGDIPIGAGLSSSAALENAVCHGLNELFGLGLTPKEMIVLSQKAEHEFAGVRCGIMDQFASMMGKKDHAFVLDCRSLDHTYFPVLLDTHEFVLYNSNVHHSLASSEYNVRREQCEQGVARLQSQGFAIQTLRDVSQDILESHKNSFDPLIFKRCLYIVEENRRVNQFAQTMAANNLNEAGDILYQGHQGMKTAYEITCPEIDFMIDFTRELPQVAGARMTGGGFGGCTLNLVKKDYIDTLTADLNQAYQEKFGKNITPIRVTLDNGVETIAI